jgi:ABC-type metal ion transport system substrate-binding protein
MANLLTITNITLFIILCGVVFLATKVLFDYSNKRWKIKVEIGHTSDNSILIAATNIGYENVTFSIVGFILPNNKLFWNQLDAQKFQIPYMLENRSL